MRKRPSYNSMHYNIPSSGLQTVGTKGIEGGIFFQQPEKVQKKKAVLASGKTLRQDTAVYFCGAVNDVKRLLLFYAGRLPHKTDATPLYLFPLHALADRFLDILIYFFPRLACGAL